MPAWMTEDDLDVYAGEFERTGFTGGLNRYRNVDRDWEDLAVFRGRPIEVPALFVGGDRDGPTIWGMAVDRAASRRRCRSCYRSVILPGCGHWTQQERPAEVNARPARVPRFPLRSGGSTTWSSQLPAGAVRLAQLDLEVLRQRLGQLLRSVKSRSRR